MTEHTPTPWEKDKYGQLRGANGVIINTKHLGVSQSLGGGEDPEGSANSALIVKAVNAHDDLVEQLSSLFYCVEATGQILGNMDAIRRLLRSLDRYTPVADTLAVKLGVDVEAK